MCFLDLRTNNQAHVIPVVQMDSDDNDITPWGGFI